MNRKTINILYRTITGMFCAMMGFSGVMNAIVAPGSPELIVDHLHYPHYFISYVGVWKVLGAIALIVPGFPRVKEWAYFGFFLDLFSAVYSMIAMGDPVATWAPIIIGLVLLFASYFLYHQRRRVIGAQTH